MRALTPQTETAQPSLAADKMFNFQRNKRKVFCLSFAGTGGDDIRSALSFLGYKAFGWHKETTATLIANILDDDIPSVFKRVHERDAFVGFPWWLCYAELDKQFTNAKFILTLPADEPRWIQDAQQRVLNDLRAQLLSNDAGESMISSYLDMKSSDAVFATYYKSTVAAIRKHFRGRPDKLLEMRVSNGDGWEKLCPFIEAPIPDAAFPPDSKQAGETLAVSDEDA